MRKNQVLFLIPFLVILLAGPSFAGFAPNCKETEVDLGAIKDKPGLYIGSFTGELPGAVSLFTLRENILRDGTIVSVIQLTFVSPLADASFSALLDVRDTPTDSGYNRDAQGEITEGSGPFAGVTGQVTLTGRLSADRGQLKTKARIRLCRP